MNLIGESFTSDSQPAIWQLAYKGRADHRRTSMKGFAVAAFQEACCRICGLEGRRCGPPAATVVVTLVALDTFVQLTIPMFQCAR